MRGLTVVLALMAVPVAADYRLEITDTGKRDYYCTLTISLTNHTDAPLTEINAFFVNYIGNRQVGRSKGASFGNVPPGGSVSAVFETPNAPCDAVERYDMVIGACRLGMAFEDQAVCADRLTFAPPFGAVSTLN